MNEDEELYRLMNEEDDFYMGDSEEEETAPSKKPNIVGCFGMFILAGILLFSTLGVLRYVEASTLVNPQQHREPTHRKCHLSISCCTTVVVEGSQ